MFDAGNDLSQVLMRDEGVLQILEKEMSSTEITLQVGNIDLEKKQYLLVRWSQ